MKNFFKRKIRIFGRSVSLSVILLLALTVVTLAAFLFSMTATVSLTAGTGVQSYFANPECEFYNNTSGVIDVCEINGSVMTITAHQLDNESVMRVRMVFFPDPDDNYYLTFSANLPDGVSSVTCELSGDDCNNLFLPMGVGGEIDMWIETADLVPDQVVDPFQIIFEIQ